MDLESFIETQINQAREERGISIAELARRSNMTPGMLAKTLRGVRDLKADELVMLCLVLELPFSKLVPLELNWGARRREPRFGDSTNLGAAARK